MSMRKSAAFVAAGLLALAPVCSVAATTAAPAVGPVVKANPPRGLTGPGSLSGLWVMQGYISSTHPARERVARDENGVVPAMLPWAKALVEKRVSDADDKGLIFANTAVLCLPQGVPYYLFGAITGPLQIIETPEQVTFISEEFNEIWLAYLNQKHRSDDDSDGPTFHGESVAHWEGNVLVIDTIRISTKTTIDQVGMPHSEALHVITRGRRVDANTLEFRITIDDPKTFEKPWTRKVLYKKAKAGERIEDYACDNQRNIIDPTTGLQGKSLEKGEP